MRRILLKDTFIKYPAVNGTHIFSDGSHVEVTNGNHIKVNTNSRSQSIINFYNVNENTENISSINNINYKSNKFLLKQGDICELRIKNITKTGDGVEFAFNLRNTIISSLKFNSGDSKSTENRIVQYMMDIDTEVGCVFIFINSGIMTIEFDVEFYVNKERWI